MKRFLSVLFILAIALAFSSQALAKKKWGYKKTTSIWTEGMVGRIKKPCQENKFKVKGFEVGAVYRIIIAPVDGHFGDEELLGASVAVLDRHGYLLNSAIYDNTLGAYTTMGFRAEAKRLQIVISSSENDTGWFRIKVEKGRVAPALAVGVPTSTMLYNGIINAGTFAYYGGDVATSWKRLVFTDIHSPNIQVMDARLVNANTNTEIMTNVELVDDKIIFTAIVEQEVATMAAEKYSLKLTVSGITGFGDFMSLSLDRASVEDKAGTFGDIAVTDASVVWSDMSIPAHSPDTSDWHNDTEVIGLPLYFPTLSN